MKLLTPKEKVEHLKSCGLEKTHEVKMMETFLTADLKEKPKIDNTSFEDIMKEMTVELKTELKKEGLI